MAIKKIIGVATLSILILTGALYITTRAYNLPSPLVILPLAVGVIPPSETYKYFDKAEIAKPRNPYYYKQVPKILDVSPSWHDGQQVSLSNFLELTNTKALLVIQNDEIVFEKYFNGAREDTLFPSYSVSKSILSSLIGIAVDKKLLSENDEVGKFLSSSALSEQYQTVKISDLLNMRSGIDVAENYSGLWAPIVEMYLTTDIYGFIRELKGLRFIPGSKFEYRSVDPQILAQVLTEASGIKISNFLSQELWESLGAEYAATWSVDSASHGVEKAFCCFNATARDFAKFGSLYLHKGSWNDKQLVSADWVIRSSTPVEFDLKRSLGYSNNWWVPMNNKEDQDFLAIGIHGQYIYVNPKKKIVIVKFSDYAIEEDVQLTISAFQLISKQLSLGK